VKLIAASKAHSQSRLRRTLRVGCASRWQIEQMKYQDLKTATDDDVYAALARDDPLELHHVPIGVSMSHPNLEWSADMCIRLSSHSDAQVRGNAVLGFGHLARRFGDLNEGRIKPIIEAALRDGSRIVRDHADAAAGDVTHYLGWKVRGYKPYPKMKTYSLYQLPIFTPDEALAMARDTAEKYRKRADESPDKTWARPCSELAALALEILAKRQFDEGSIRGFHNRYRDARRMLKGIPELAAVHDWLVEDACKWNYES